jgi:hypothetical protein
MPPPTKPRPNSAKPINSPSKLPRKGDPMLSMPVPMKLPLALSCALLVSACASNGSPNIAFPLAAELTPPAKPELSVEAVASNSATALAEHNGKVEAWGDAMAAQIGRLCSWARSNGMPNAPCR